MQVAFALIFLIIIIALILGLIGSFIGGIVTIILTVKRAKKRKAEGLGADGRQIFMIVLSVLLLIAPVGAGGAIIANRAGLAIKRAGYSNFTDRWRNESVLNEPRNESFSEILKMAEAGDADGIYASFAQGKQNDRLRSEIDEFIKKYPKGLSECEIDLRGGSSGGNGKEEKFSSSACIEKDGYFYYLNCSACYQSENPSKIGITGFSIVSQEVYALSRGRKSDPLGYKEIYCLTEPSEPVDVVVIQSTAYIRQNDAPPIAYDDALRAVRELSDKNGYTDRFGAPVVSDIAWYWEVEPDGDMQRYLCIYPENDGSVDKKQVHISGRNDSYKYVRFDEEGNISNK